MTDNEIIKALECCSKNPPSCVDCNYKGKCNRRDCYDYLKLDALDLINRQRAEIARLARLTHKMEEPYGHKDPVGEKGTMGEEGLGYKWRENDDR